MPSNNPDAEYYPLAAARAQANDLSDGTRESPLSLAFTHLGDRLNRLEYVLGDVNGVVMRAGSHLEPLLTDSTYHDPDTEVEAKAVPTGPTPEDRRSTITRRVDAAADRADLLADAAARIGRRLEAILDALEL